MKGEVEGTCEPLTIVDAQDLMVSGEASPLELMESVLARIDEGDPLNAWIHLDREHALAEAKAAGKRKRRPPLYGIPICVKDVIDVAGMPTTAGSASWSRRPMKDAVAVERLRAAGAIVIGKGNTNEFAYGIDGLNSHWGDVGNPVDPARIAGGSSSGPAAAVGAGMALGGLGTDTSGSIRVPASLCGLVGLRPSFGLVPAGGVIPLAPSYDVVGPIARTVADAAILTEALLGRGASKPIVGVEGMRGLRIALSEDLLERVDVSIANLVGAAAEDLEDAGAEIGRIRVPAIERAEEAHLIIQLYEAARVHSDWFETLRDEYEDPVRLRLEAARKVTSTEYRNALETRQAVIQGFTEAMEGFDLLLAPASPITAPLKGMDEVEVRGERTSMRAALLSCVVPLTQTTGPVLTLPAGEIEGLPAGFQILGRPSSEPLLFKVAAAVERARLN